MSPGLDDIAAPLLLTMAALLGLHHLGKRFGIWQFVVEVGVFLLIGGPLALLYMVFSTHYEWKFMPLVVGIALYLYMGTWITADGLNMRHDTSQTGVPNQPTDQA